METVDPWLSLCHQCDRVLLLRDKRHQMCYTFMGGFRCTVTDRGEDIDAVHSLILLSIH